MTSPPVFPSSSVDNPFDLYGLQEKRKRAAARAIPALMVRFTKVYV